MITEDERHARIAWLSSEAAWLDSVAFAHRRTKAHKKEMFLKWKAKWKAKRKENEKDRDAILKELRELLEMREGG